MTFFKNLIFGFFIGTGAILPGISSGVLCVILGIYEKLLNSILQFFSDIKQNLKFLVPIFLGAFCGMVLFGNVLMFLFNTYPLQIQSIFIGLILGSIPHLLNQVNDRCSTKTSFLDIVFIIFSSLVGIFLVIAENFLGDFNINYSNLYLVLSGFLMSVGVVVPGISSTIILMLLGVYDVYLASVSLLNFQVLIPMGIGLILGSLIFMRLIKFLLNRYYSKTFYSIIGFTIGSIFVLAPSIASFADFIVFSLSIFIGFLISHFF